MNKVEIKSELEKILENSNINEIKDRVSELTREFHSLYNAEKSVLEEKENAGEVVEINEKEDKLNNEIFQLIETYKERVKAFHQAIKDEEKNNFNLKKELIEEFSNLIASEENLSKLFGTIKEIRAKWNEIGNIPKDTYYEIQSQFSKLNEEFNYNVNIYKELQDNDLKKNYSLKNQVIHKVKELLDDPKIKGLDKKVRKLQNEWEEIGPTYKEHWEQLKEAYWTGVKDVYTKIKAHYENQKEQLQENLNKKIALIEKAKGIVVAEANSHGDWDKLTKEITGIQEEWKSIGYVSKEHNDKIWNDFRSILNNFFDNKSVFYKERNSVAEKNKALKKSIIEKTKELLNSEDVKSAANQIIRLQKDWKNIGHAGKFAEQKLWNEFRSKCDSFFNARDEHYKKMDAENEGNLKLKEAIISKINAYEVKEDNKKTVEDLKAFSKEFSEIGNVPFKEKDKIYKNYKAALDEKYNAIKMDKEEKEKILLEAKIESIKASANPIKLFREEKDRIRKKMNEITKEVTNYENNLGFFSNSKGAEALLKGVNDNIEKGKKEIERLKKKLNLFPKES